MPAWRWVFHDPLTLEDYTFDINPDKGGSPAFKKKIAYQATTAPDGSTIIMEGQDEVMEAQFSGTVLTRPQYDAMYAWFGKRHVVQYTDDLGRVFQVYIKGFQPERVRSALYPWKHTYTVDYVVLSFTEP